MSSSVAWLLIFAVVCSPFLALLIAVIKWLNRH